MPAWGAVGAIASAGIGYLGQQSTNRAQIEANQEAQQSQFLYNQQGAIQQQGFNAEEAEKARVFSANQVDQQRVWSARQAELQMGFQEKMSGTAYQRAVRDMKDAGLNPMLAYAQGGASTPPGAQGSSSAASGAQASGAAANVGLAAPQIGNKVAAGLGAASQAYHLYKESELLGAQKGLIEAQTKKEISSAGHLDVSASNIRQEMQTFNARWERLKAEAGIKQLEQWSEQDRYNWLRGGKGYEPRLEEKFGAELRAMVEHANELKSKAELYNLEIPKAVNEANAESSWFKRNISPYMPDILKGATSIRGLR